MDLIKGLELIGLLIAAWVAIYGIDAWRREHAGKRKLELAEDTLAAFYEAADAIRHIRSPAGYASEISEVIRGDRETEADFEARRNASVVLFRYNQHQELFNKLHAMRYRFMAQIGKKEAQSFEDMRAIVNEILASAHILARLWARDRHLTDIQLEQHRKRLDKFEAVFWEGLPEDDPINPKVAKIIAEVELVCADVIAGQGSLHSFLNRKVF